MDEHKIYEPPCGSKTQGLHVSLDDKTTLCGKRMRSIAAGGGNGWLWLGKDAWEQPDRFEQTRCPECEAKLEALRCGS